MAISKFSRTSVPLLKWSVFFCFCFFGVEVVFSDSGSEFVEPQTTLPLQETPTVLFGKSENEFRRSTSESTAGNQKKGYTAHSSAKLTAASRRNSDAHLASVARSAAGRTIGRNDDGGGG